MKIGLVRRGYSPTGGAEAYLLRLAGALAASGHTPVLITADGWPSDRWISDDVLRLDAATPSEFAAAFRNAATGCDIHLSLERVPGCEVFRAGDGVHASWLERRARFEPAWKRMTRWINGKHRQILDLEREVFDPAHTRAVIANSQLVRNEILGRFHFPPERVHVVYNGLTPEPPADRSDARRAYGIPDDAFCALFVGTGWERKGLETAVRAVEKAGKTILLVAGRGPAEKFPSPAARFLGPVDGLAGLHAAADLFLLPTWYDPFSNACLEALSAGLPVLTTPANGFSEIIRPGVHGDTVSEGDADALARAINGWRGRCAAARGACRALAAEFPIERNASGTLAVLAAAAGTGPSIFSDLQTA